MRTPNRTTALSIIVLLLLVVSYSETAYSESGVVEAKESETVPETQTREKYLSDDGIVHLQREMDIVDLIKAVSEINDEVYVIEEDLKPKEVSIITPEAGMQKDEVLKLFDIILNMNGLTIVKRQGINKVVYISDIGEQATPVESEN